MRSGDRPGLQNRRAAGSPVAGGFDPHSLPPFSLCEVSARTQNETLSVLRISQLTSAITLSDSGQDKDHDHGPIFPKARVDSRLNSGYLIGRLHVRSHWGIRASSFLIPDYLFTCSLERRRQEAVRS